MNATINKSQNVLEKLHADASKDMLRMSSGIVKSIFRPMQPADFKDVYLPISKEQGETMRQLIIDNECKNVVEFGTSFGISTIYLADAVTRFRGKVVTTELLESKAKRASQNIKEAGLADFVDVRIGDAMITLKEYYSAIDFLFLDGWKDLYLPLFKMLEPLFHTGTLIYADNMDMAGTHHYGDYVLAKSNLYTTQKVHNGKAFLSTVL